MPPRNGARRPHAASNASGRSVPPTLKPFLDNLPPPTSISSGRETSANDGDTFEDEMPTPTKPHYDRPMTKDDEDEEHDDDEDADTVDDDEFESHYSRQSSPASSSVDSDEDLDSITEEKEARDGTKLSTGSVVRDGFVKSSSSGQIHRVSSMPTAAPSAFQIHPHMSHTNSLHLSRSTTSLSRVAPPIPPPLYPPFYNRPPTPLPPSPSLTSLLRPPSLLNRSTTSTRPTTPDSSDAETPNDTEAAVAHSARRANPLPPTAPKVPTYEYYGFVLYLASSLAFLIYILWSYLPSAFLHALGVTYYPNRWWSLAIPAWIVMALIYTYVALACWNVEYMTMPLERLGTMVDDAGNVAILDENGRIRRGGSKRFVADAEEKRRRDLASGSHSWTKKTKGGGSGRSKRDRRRDRDEADDAYQHDWYGYTGDVMENGVASGLAWRQIWNEGTDAVMDIPLGGVCEVLYGEGRDMLL